MLKRLMQGAAAGAAGTTALNAAAEWEAASWASDAVPHLAFGAVTYGALAAMSGRS
jgi:hypothetical protein